ncbi:hypothetical protein LCGC14_2237270 [marine sediment metagenome]|uniref:Bacteriophage Mu GpT domain-containing protein n=1 Tax=marine sediment metagenome TaxID=412755 RepID=A0A0F9FJ22_9ZZZZ
MAIGTTDFIDISSADVFLEEKWSQQSTIARMKKLIFGQYVDRSFEAELRKGQILRIGNITQPTGRAKGENTAITYETVSEGEVTITINNFYYAAIALEDVVEPMVSVSLLDRYVPGLGYAVGLLEDDDIAGLVDTGTLHTVGTLGTGLTHTNLLRADQYLNDSDVPDDNRFIIISPAERANLLELDQFVHKDYADLRSGLIGSWLQYPIYVSNNCDGSNSTGHDNVMMHKECIAHIAQIKPMVKAFYDIDYFAAKMATLTTWGNTIRRADHGVWMKGA